jgi:hypothetical protein
MCYASMFSISSLYCNSGVCLQACYSLMPVAHHGLSSGGLIVVIMVVSVVLRCREIHNE